MVFTWLRQLAEGRIHIRKLLFCYRFETGATDENLHYHVLVAGLGDLPIGFCRRANALWLRGGGGHARITKFCHSRGGVHYVLKVLPCYGKSGRIRDDETMMPTLSRSVVDFLRHRRIR